MQARIDQISDRIYRISTCIPEIAPGGFTFNQFLIDADEPLLYHTGMRALFPAVREAVERVMPLPRLRWIAFAHLEADECGAVNEFLEAAPHAQVAHGALGCLLSLNDQCLRPPRPMNDGEVLELGGAALARRVVEIATPHVPHNWESHMFFETETRTLFCGDLLTQLGEDAAHPGFRELARGFERRVERLARHEALDRALEETALAQLACEPLAAGRFQEETACESHGEIV